MITLAAHRLTLSAAEYRYLVEKLGLSMPPGWEPKVVGLPSQPLDIHPSVEMNLRILARPRAMLDTSATVGPAGSHSLHAIAGSLGASLFALADGGVELSMFAAVQLGQELIRAVPETDGGGAGPSGRLPVEALRELSLAELMRASDPNAVAEVLGMLGLPPDEAALATRVVEAGDGALVCMITAWVGGEVRSARVVWLHANGEWVGITPDPDSSGRRMVRLEPVAREDLGVWVAPYLAEALADG